MSNKPTYLQERTRCLRLVEAYRERIEEWMNSVDKFPESVSAQMVAERITESLRKIESEIKSPRDRKGSDFSMDEMERAEAIIAEQNVNPFEG